MFATKNAYVLCYKYRNFRIYFWREKNVVKPLFECSNFEFIDARRMWWSHSLSVLTLNLCICPKNLNLLTSYLVNPYLVQSYLVQSYFVQPYLVQPYLVFRKFLYILSPFFFYTHFFFKPHFFYFTPFFYILTFFYPHFFPIFKSYWFQIFFWEKK